TDVPPSSQREYRRGPMAVSALKRGEAVVWVPPRAVGERAFATEPRLLVGLAGSDGLVIQASSLDALPRLRSVRLVFDARDVNLLPAKLPPLAGARLRRALPTSWKIACSRIPSPACSRRDLSCPTVREWWP